MRPALEGLSLVPSQLGDFLSVLQITGTKSGLFALAMFSEARQSIVRFVSYICSRELSHIRTLICYFEQQTPTNTK